MAKAAILNVLEETIGRYVQGLDAKSLNVAVWAGKIELQSLQLDTEAVNRELARQALDAPNLAIPFRIVEGSFESLKVEVPWARLTSKPVVLKAVGLNATIEPFDHLTSKFIHEQVTTPKKSTTYTSDGMKKKKSKEERFASLQHAEEARQRFNAMREITEMDEEEFEDDKSGQTRGSSSGFKARLVRRIIENIQVDIDDIQFTLKGHGCDAGIQLDRFSVFTTDKNGKKSFIDRATNSQNIMKSFLYKALELDGLNIYLDEQRITPKALNTNYKPLDGENKSYILAPLSFRARLRQSDCLECIDFPKYLLSANLPNVSLRLSRTQLEVLYDITNEIQKMKYVARPLFPEYRPNVPVSKSSAKLWWKYAVRSIGRINRRRSWVEFFIAYKKRKNYISMYKRLTYSSECPWLTPLFIQERAELDSIESDKSISTKGIMAWRNMADAQYNLEMKKFEQIEASKKLKKSSPKKKTSFRSMIFGNKDKDDEILLLDQESLDINEPPISLSEAEMRELDVLALEAANAEMTLSTDSILCDVTFEMGSFAIDLITFASAPLLSLEMGTVITVLKANADGSFSSSFALSSMNVYDRITMKTLFPNIIRSLQSSADSLLDSTFKNAIELKLTKARNGDQGFEAKLVSYEIVACDNLLKELKKFFTMTNLAGSPSTHHKDINPMLQYSVTGGADVFYDAGDFGSSTMFQSKFSKFDHERSETVDSMIYNYLHTNNKQKVSDKLSSAFADAWKNKLESEVVWSIEIQLHAPIIVIPENCTNTNSTVLVVDFGTLHLAYGKKLSPRIDQWFRNRVSSEGVVKADHCSIEMEHFSFQISKAGKRDWLLSRSSSRTGSTIMNSIIDPVTFNIDIGVENGPLNRKCMFGVLENISLSLSHFQIIETMSVLSTWNDTISSLSNSGDYDGAMIVAEEDCSNQKLTSIGILSHESSAQYAGATFDLTHISLALQELKVTITNESNESVRAHLLSVTSSSTNFSDGSSSIQLKMGHFWILDHLNSNFPRHQRLLVHSTLPRSAEEYASLGNFNIMQDFEEYIATNGDYPIDSLADIAITKSIGCDQGDSPFHLNRNDINKTTIDAKFSVLFIHWNPYTIRDLLSFQRNFIAVSDRMKSFKISRSNSFHDTPPMVEQHSALLLVNAQMEAFDLSFNSALDDLLLFHMNMSKTSVIFHSFKQNNLDDDNLMASVFVGDFRLTVPKSPKIVSEYQIILGLDDTHSTSLLELEYGKGNLAMKSCPAEAKGNDVEMFMTVFLSPMRFVHIQAQVLTIVEFLTEGVLGAITEKVASSAARAAAALTQAKSEGEKMFLICAKGFNIILPQAAYNGEYFSLDIAKMSINFRSLPDPGAGIADICLQRLTMSCNRGVKLIEEPIIMDVNVCMAPLSSPSPHEMATKVKVDISRISLLLSRQHYNQVMKTLDLNIGELNSFLRETDLLVVEEGSTIRQRLTHGGAEEVVIKKRLYMQFHFEAMCLELCHSSSADPLIALTALETDLDMQLIPDEDVMNLAVTLLDLDVEDRRIDSNGKHFRMLIQQINNSKKNDIFRIAYSKNKKERTTSTNLTLGSPRIVFIPDAVCEVLAFFKSDKPPNSIVLENNLDLRLLPAHERKKMIERESNKIEFTMLTDDCSFVFIDLQTISRENKRIYTEAIVLKGQLDLTATSESDLATGNSLKRDVQIHGENLEIVSAEGPQLVKPLQILDPVKFSLFFRSNLNEDTEVIDFSFVTLTAVNTCVSMRQSALFLAVMSGARESFGLEKPSDELSSDRPLTEKETGKINELALALQEQSLDLDPSDHDATFSRHSSGNTSQSSRLVRQSEKRVFQVKLTIPSSSLTVINDLQGVDEALFKIIFSSVVNNTEICLTSKSEETVFHSHTYWVIDSDYFDSHSKRWEKLLIHPWELDFKAVRGKKKNTRRMATTVDIESHPCHISFSEQFIISIKGAQEMWDLFKGTNDKAMGIIKDFENLHQLDKRELAQRKAMARSATRSLTTVLPYGISNRSGLSVTYRVAVDEQFPVEEEVSYFSFPLYSSIGTGGRRLYGQEATESKTIVLSVEGEEIIIEHLDADIGLGKRVHYLRNGQYIFTEAEETGKSTILYISSFMDIYNDTCLDIPISLSVGRTMVDIGLSKAVSTLSSNLNAVRKAVRTKPLGVNSQVLCNAYHPSAVKAAGVVSLGLSPNFDSVLYGDLQLPPLQAFHQMGIKGQQKSVEVVCKSKTNADSITLRITCRVFLIDGCPLVEFFIQPRLILSNESFVNITARTAMLKTASKNTKTIHSQGQRQDEHILAPFDTIQVFQSGQSVAFSFRCTDIPIGGNRTGWNKYGWIDIPLSLNAHLNDKLLSSFPFLDSSGKPSNHGGGCDFFLVEEDGRIMNTMHHKKSSHVQQMEKVKTIKISVENLGVDHTGDVLFESWDVHIQNSANATGDVSNFQNFSFSSYASALHKRRISILPSSNALIRILHLSMDGDDPYKRSLPFSIEDITFCDGGLEATPLSWDDGSESGYFAYRKLSTFNQSEIHIIPEYVIYNGGKEKVRVTIQQKNHIQIDAGKMSIAKKVRKKQGLVMSLIFENLEIMSAPVQVDELGLKVVLLRSITTGEPIGSVPIQTVIGSRDSRFVIKLGELKRGGLSLSDKGGISKNDFLHFRVRWSQLEITFLDTSLPVNNTILEKNSYQSITKFALNRFTLDYQRLFKEDMEEIISAHHGNNSARSQFSAIIKSVRVHDCTTSPETLFLDSESGDYNFMDTRVRTKGESNSGIVKIDLIEVKLGHDGKRPHEIIINTNEAFLWSLLDVASRTKIAISEFSSMNTDVNWDDDTKSFRVSAREADVNTDDDIEEDGTYKAPRGDILLAVKKMYVSQSAFLLSFKRQPQTARYKQVQNIGSAKIVNYFTKKLNFTVDRARLKFASFSLNNVKGPPDRIVQSVKTFYLAQMKKKMFTLLTATSIDEWKQLAGRDDGKDSYVEGDILRMGGNLAGKSAGYLVKQVGKGIGSTLKTGTSELGKGIQNVTEVMGIGAVGAGVNSLVSGVGEGVSSTVEGVGDGGNKIIKGAGKAVGQIAGGLGGGLLGISKGVATGDGKALAEGVGSIGTGVIKGTESVVVGVGEGVFQVGMGLFKGVQRLGSGVGDALTGNAPSNRSSHRRNHNSKGEYDA